MKTKSYMVAVPKQEDDLKNVEAMLNHLSNSADCKLISHELNENLEFTVETCGKRYDAEAFPANLEIPEMYRAQHLFPDVDIQAIEKAKVGLAVSIEFDDDALSSYHAQLKIISSLLPDAIAVIDDSSEKILSGRWVRLAASSKVPPAPRYIYTVQAVSGDDGCVWLHSHGLNRCGLPELEILNSTKDTYQNHYNIIETMANRMLELEEPLEKKEPLYLARLSEDISVVTTMVDWQEAVKLYPADMLGGENDRKEGHNENTCAIFVYPTYNDYEKKNFIPVSIFDEILENNPIYMLTSRETKRMKMLAGERIGYMLKAFENRENKVLVKIGLEVDREFRDGNNTSEHIWFELLDTSDGRVRAKLIQEPYYVKNMHEGSEGTYTFDKITDWIIYTKEGRITADDVYLMD